MPTEIVMPQMGESIFEGTITKWLKKAGDPVQKDEPLFEISTDKVDAEIPSPISGVLTEIKCQEGETVAINTVVALVGEVGSAIVSTQANDATVPATAAPATVASPMASNITPPVAPKKAAPTPAPNAAAANQNTSTDAVEIVMPQMGESIFEGTITKWLKKVGDNIAKDEPIFEISTDKVDAEIPATVAGVLTEIKVPEGATVAINTVVAIIGGIGGGVVSGVMSGVVGASTTGAVSNDISTSPVAARNEPSAAPAPATSPSAGEKLRSSPLVRRIAQENNLDLRQITGTGLGGRITKEDALLHLSQRSSASTAPTPAIAASTLPGTIVPLSKMRAIIAQRMVESLAISPHVHSVYKVDMTRIVRLRERQKATYEQKNGVRLTYMPFIAAAAIQSLLKFPIVNASLEGTNIHYHQNIHLGIAVALDWGLIVPVVRNAEQQSFVSLARTIADLATRARIKKLKPDEVSGSTFTLTNSGIFGDEFGTPIINQPESAILAIGVLKKEPVVLTDDQGNDSIAIRSMQHFCLGFDHRTIDGADAGKFMSEFKRSLENWDQEIG